MIAAIQLSDFANRLTGSSDLYQSDGRKPYASINFITAHDGFTLCDLVSFDGKHNEANLDDNNDGANDNDSWNMGAEGPTDDAAINELRERQTRNFLATLMLSQGVPMLAGGDEVARSQRGNNNCYCQDNELTWYDWNLDPPRRRLRDFTSELIQFRLATRTFIVASSFRTAQSIRKVSMSSSRMSPGTTRMATRYPMMSGRRSGIVRSAFFSTVRRFR